jgi:hypothetical protein
MWRSKNESNFSNIISGFVKVAPNAQLLAKVAAVCSTVINSFSKAKKYFNVQLPMLKG